LCIDFKVPKLIFEVSELKICCRAMTANCLACAAGLTIKEYCDENPTTAGCKAPMEKEQLPEPHGDPIDEMFVFDPPDCSKGCGSTCIVGGDMLGLCDKNG
jgi:hypothetical protein